MAPSRNPGRGRLPSVENLKRKTPEELASTLNRFGINPDIRAIDRRARASILKIERSIQDAVMPDEATLQAFAASVEKDMTQNLRKMVKTTIRGYKQAKVSETGAKLLVWIATSNGIKSCPSCKARNGKVKTKAQWERMGLPGSSALLCGDDCLCHLGPAPG